MVMITHTNTARESNLINFNFRGLEPVLMQLFITQREQERGLAAEVFNAGHKLKHTVVFQAPKAAISEQTPLIPSQGHREKLSHEQSPTRSSYSSGYGTSAIPHGTMALGCICGAELPQEPISAGDPHVLQSLHVLL